MLDIPAEKILRKSRLQSGKILTGVAVLNKRNLLRCSASHNAAAAVAAFRSEINDIIRRFNYVEIVLDNKDTAAAVTKAFKNGKQSFNISNMQSCRRLIENTYRSTPRWT